MGWLRDGAEYGTGQVTYYRAHLSPTEEVRIANFGGPHYDDWRVLRIKDGANVGDWTGQHASAEEALSACS